MSKLAKIMAFMSVLTLAQSYAFADDDHHGRRDSRHEHREAWRGDIRHFHEHDINLWRGGRWYYGRHGGNNAWWWIAGGIWYVYPSPVYPYPDPYQPPVVIAPQQSKMPPATGPYWYYCQNPAGYYPYVAQCMTDWQKVPATNPPDEPR